MANKRLKDLLEALDRAKVLVERHTTRTLRVNEKIEHQEKGVKDAEANKAAVEAKRDDKLKENPKADVSSELRQISFQNARITRGNDRIAELRKHKSFTKLAEAQAARQTAEAELAAERTRQTELLKGNQTGYLRSSESLATQESRCKAVERTQAKDIVSMLSRWYIPSIALGLYEDLGARFSWTETVDVEFENFEKGLIPRASWWYQAAFQGLGKSFWENEVAGRGLEWNWDNLNETADTYFNEAREEGDASYKFNQEIIKSEISEELKETWEKTHAQWFTHSNFTADLKDQLGDSFNQIIESTAWYADEKDYSTVRDEFNKKNHGLRSAYSNYIVFTREENTLKWLEDVKTWFKGDTDSTTKAGKAIDKYKGAFADDKKTVDAEYAKSKKEFSDFNDELQSGLDTFEAAVNKAESFQYEGQFVNAVEFHGAQGATPANTNDLTRVDAVGEVVSDGKAWLSTHRWQTGAGGKAENKHRYEDYAFKNFKDWNANALETWPDCLPILDEAAKKTSETDELKSRAVAATSDITSTDYTARKARLLSAKESGGYPLPDAKVARVLTQYAGADWKSITEGIKKAVEAGKGFVIFEGSIQGVALRILTELNYKVEALVDNIDHKTGQAEQIRVGNNVVDVFDTATKVSWDQAAYGTDEEPLVRKAANDWNWDTSGAESGK